MKYIDNFKHWIKQEWIDELLTSKGMARFKEGPRPDSPIMQAQWDNAVKAGYNLETEYFYMFDKNNVSFEINPPWCEGKNFHWWITKMLPGNCMPIHTDPHTSYELNSQRYWIPLQYYQNGHWFVYNDVVITDYKAGDVYQYDDSRDPHGAINVGITPRLVLQVSTSK